jgi:hypothetical protein
MSGHTEWESFICIVAPATAPIHREADAGRRQHTGELTAGELASLVGVEVEISDLAELRQRLLQRCEAEGVEAEVAVPSDQITR